MQFERGRNRTASIFFTRPPVPEDKIGYGVGALWGKRNRKVGEFV